MALYGTCGKTCGVTAVTGRSTVDQARADGKRECEAYYRASCQLAQEWEEKGSNQATPVNAPQRNGNDIALEKRNKGAEISTVAEPTTKPKEVVLGSERSKLRLIVSAPAFADGPKGVLNKDGFSKNSSNGVTEYKARFNAPLATPGTGLAFIATLYESEKGNVESLERLVGKAFAESGISLEYSKRIGDPLAPIPNAETTSYAGYGRAYGNHHYGNRVVQTFIVRLKDGTSAYILNSSLLVPYADKLKDAEREIDLRREWLSGILDYFTTEGVGHASSAIKEGGADDVRELIALCGINEYEHANKLSCKKLYDWGIASGNIGIREMNKATDFVTLINAKGSNKNREEASKFVVSNGDISKPISFDNQVDGTERAMRWLIGNLKVIANYGSGPVLYEATPSK